MKHTVFRRVLGFVLVLALLLPGSVFATAPGEQLLKYGFIEASEKGLAESEALTREELAKMICEVIGKADEAKGYAGALTYADASEISDWAKPYVAFVTDKNLMNGVGNGKFSPKAAVDEKHIGVVLLRALGYQFNWIESSVKLYLLGVAPVKEKVTKGEAYEYLWNFLKQPVGKFGHSAGEVFGKFRHADVEAIQRVELVQSARNFKLNRVADGVQELYDGSGKRFLLVSKDAKVPAGYEDAAVISVPIATVVVGTTPVAGYLNVLGKDVLGTVVGVTTGEEDWAFPEIAEGIREKKITLLENQWGSITNYEQVIAMKPDLVVVDAYNVEAYTKLRESLEKFGIPVIVMAEYSEKYVYGTIEWVRLFGALYEKNAAADFYFETAKKQQDALYEKAKNIEDANRVSVAMGLYYWGTLYSYGKDTALGESIRKLGGRYVFDHIDGNSITLSMEEFIAGGKDADVLIYTTLPQQLAGGAKELVENLPQIKEFKAYKNNRIYIYDKGIYMNKVDETSKLKDILSILHPELMPNHTLKMYRHLDVNK